MVIMLDILLLLNCTLLLDNIDITIYAVIDLDFLESNFESYWVKLFLIPDKTAESIGVVAAKR